VENPRGRKLAGMWERRRQFHERGGGRSSGKGALSSPSPKPATVCYGLNFLTRVLVSSRVPSKDIAPAETTRWGDCYCYGAMPVA